ncbi:Protein FAR1-RELATED SEQUENCE 7 [Linum grandiflorum]
MKAIGRKKPKAVVTDGDVAMLNAIKEVFPEAVNRRCARHIRKNLKSLHFKEEVINDCYQFVYRNYDETVFEEKWKQFLQKHSLEDNQQICNLYEKRIDTRKFVPLLARVPHSNGLQVVIIVRGTPLTRIYFEP